MGTEITRVRYTGIQASEKRKQEEDDGRTR